jgi:hypothetical protein
MYIRIVSSDDPQNGGGYRRALLPISPKAFAVKDDSYWPLSLKR